MPGLTPAGLFDVLELAIAEAVTRRRWWHGQSQVAVWFTTPTVQIGTRVWVAVHDAGTHRHGYTLRQARQMRAALLPILNDYAIQAAAVARHLQPHPTDIVEDTP